MRISSSHVLFLALVSLLTACAITIVDTTGQPSELSAETFANGRNTKGIVLLDVNWGRRWSCGGFENAELRGLAFDRMSSAKPSDDMPPDLMLQQPPSLASRPTFVNYALLVEPGEYALSGFNIKVARSVSDIGYWVAKRSDMLKDGKILGGSFKIAAGETIYIGNFSLDCYQRPQLWRYYTEGADNFKLHLAQYKQKYPFLNTDHAIYRLFETNSLGRSYELK